MPVRTRSAGRRFKKKTGAELIRDGFQQYQEAFQAITRRAARRFAGRDWHGMQRDSLERLDLYRAVLGSVLGRLREALGERVLDRAEWPALRDAFSPLVAADPNQELAETFFNSVTRRLFSTVGVDPGIEFVHTAGTSLAGAPEATHADRVERGTTTTAIVERALGRAPLQARWSDLRGDAELVARRLEAAAARAWGAPCVEAIELLQAPFFRGKSAYLVGRVRGVEATLPLVLALLHEPSGLRVDAVLTDEDSVSIVFGFTRAYFHVETEQPARLLGFLKSLLPAKKLAELYISIGHNKHGKTELYRDLLRHLSESDDRFEIAPGEPGMVMAVFTLPRHDLVFKVIRDRFGEPKRTTREAVMGKYDLVFRHDRAGRLIDAQEFEHLEFPRERFAEDLLQELLTSAGSSVSAGRRGVAIRHLYVERRLAPLNLYLREAAADAARAAVLDFGQSIKDMAATGIFPGDVLTKNFGLTRHGRVVFYDYDELTMLEDCVFRELPEPRDGDEELAAEPWFYVGEDDIFPEEFQHFLGLTQALRAAFMDAHSDLFEAGFWRGLQERIRAGEIVDIYPYRAEQRLRR